MLEPGRIDRSSMTRVPTRVSATATAVGRLGQVELRIGIAEQRADRRQLVQQPSLECARLDLVLLAREFVDDRTRAFALRIRSRSSEARYHWIFSPLRVRMPSSRGLIRSSVPLSAKRPGAGSPCSASRPCSSSSGKSVWSVPAEVMVKVAADRPEPQSPMPNSPCRPLPPPSAFSRRLIESQMCVATYLKFGRPSSSRGTPSPSSLIER